MTSDTARAKRLSALAHPLRLEVLMMAESVPISASEAAVALGEPLGTVAYHFRVLHTAGLIELASTERRRRLRGRRALLLAARTDAEAFSQFYRRQCGPGARVPRASHSRSGVGRRPDGRDVRQRARGARGVRP